MHGCGQEVLLTAHECASRIGLSIRALRLYEKHGLISPRRTSKQWRLYGSGEVARLNEIMALKSIGLSLRDISKLLRGQSTDLVQILALQRDALADTRNRAERGLTVIEALQTKIRSGTPASVDDLMTLAKETNMTEPLKNTVAWRRYEQMRPRTEVVIDAALYDEYAGAYETTDGILSIVSHRDGRIFSRIVGQSDIEIFPESETEFFMKALPVQITFERGEDHQVRRLSHHQNGFEDHAFRVDLDQVRNIEDAVQQRIRDQKPVPEGEIVLRNVIEEHARGEPDLDKMSPALAVLAEEQKGFIQTELEKAGKLKHLSFKGVSQVGLDIYDADFEHAKIEWGFALTHRGRISHLYLRQTP
ncbi:DNA-binding transcriptional regulator, MerR family [Rhizobium sp. NFR07]|uniref:MerR family transcriptional regulator n=1 Tax=Rhizobium sp. NFR07 TaxID=1566262 RepID=UPI0008F19C2D|nr:MerR family transcriptional regulator [Rhizobium sp. NFR07]SFB57181.1 DNA-binding transcriptional regulator, MerR family [Rhizobium sp. NFR07]